MKIRASLLVATWLAGCASANAIPKVDPVHGVSLGDRNDACTVDDECSGDLVCDHGRCMPWGRMHGEVPEITPQELEARLAAGDVQVLDVRTGVEYSMSHVAGAVHVPLGKLDGQVSSLPFDKSKPVVTICFTAHRSIAAVRLLQRHGYDVVQLQGGMIRAGRADLPRERGSDRDGQAQPVEAAAPGASR